MTEIPRLNGVIRALEQGKPTFVTFSPAEIGAAQAINAAPYDGVVFEMEHRPYDIRALRDCLQFMLDRRQILRAGNPARERWVSSLLLMEASADSPGSTRVPSAERHIEA